MMSRVHFLSNLFYSKAQHDMAGGDQAKSQSSESSGRSSLSTPELSQHRNSVDGPCLELPGYEDKTTECHQGTSFPCNGCIEESHGGLRPPGALWVRTSAPSSPVALERPANRTPLAVRCISAPTSALPPPSPASSKSSERCVSQNSFLSHSEWGNQAQEAVSKGKTSSNPNTPDRHSGPSRHFVRSTSSLPSLLSPQPTRQSPMRRVPSKGLAGVEVGMNKLGTRVGPRTSALLRSRESTPYYLP
ncbi:hypothetical protein DUNSADRAFT_874 [Dunaliella salina]|uniref:Encoded protein n=1 Tax=Dunaliella salina TaxID=3046 RepID=A0ABQ7FY75_DUNSA|nr:hypothetical protein DUNSADRAFT_874 [Dunaliella salina]|eukprot:KAF5827311.1 hypothetical protein DUNSADRAFT_874 [Dunaliella salina]